MSAVLIDLASEEDDTALRRLMRETPMEGDLSVAFAREPSFFAASRIEGTRQDVMALRRRDDPGRIVATATRSIRPLWFGGEVRELGYLSGLRSVPDARGSTLLARGYRYLRELHDRDPVPLYYSTIIEDNREVIRVLTSGRARLPTYHDVGRLRTHSVSLFRRRKGPVPGIDVTPGSRELLPAIVACLERSGRRHPLAPAIGAAEIEAGAPLLPGLGPESFYVASRGGAVVGCLARWDQGAFKQSIVVAYRGTMRWVRPLYGVVARLGGFAPLPPPGERFPYFYVSFVAIDDDDPEVFRALLHRVYDDSLGGRWSFFMVGLHERDPLNAALSGFRFIPYDARLYAVQWPDLPLPREPLDELVPRPEIAVM